MPIKPLTVLPQLKPVTYQDPAQNNQSFRILEEIIQQENANERARQTGLLASEKAYGDLLEKNAPLADNPYQQRELGAVEEEKMNFTKRLQNTYDPVERMSLVNQAQSSLFNKPGYSSALQEKAYAERFNDIAKSNADDVDPDFYNKVMSEYYREDRTTPMRPQDFNPGRLLKSPDKAADDFIKNLKYDDETIDFNRETNQVIVRKNTVLADENTFKDALAERMASSVVYQDWDIKKTDAFINRKWEEEKRKASGTVVKTMHSFEDDAEKAEKLENSKKKEAADGFDEALQPGGKAYKDPSGNLLISRDEDGVIHVWDKEGNEVASGDMGKVWGSLTPYLQNKAKELGLEPSYDLSIGGTGYKKEEIIRDGEDVVSDGLSKEDAPLAGKSTTTIKDNTLTTNDPGVLQQAGYTVGYDDKKKKYYITRVVKGVKETIYENDASKALVTDGGSGKGTAKTFTVKLDKPVKAEEKADGSKDVGEIKDTRTGVEIKDAAVGQHVPKMEPQRLDTFRNDVSSMYQSGVKNPIVKRSENASQDSLATNPDGAVGTYQFQGVHKDNFLKSIGESDWRKAYEKLGKEEFEKKQDEYFEENIKKPAITYLEEKIGLVSDNKGDGGANAKSEIWEVVNDYLASTANQSSEKGWKSIVDDALSKFKGDRALGPYGLLEELYKARVNYIMGLPKEAKKKSKYYERGEWGEVGINRPYQDYVAALDRINFLKSQIGLMEEAPAAPTQVQAPPPPPANNNAPALKSENVNVLKAKKKINIQ